MKDMSQAAGLSRVYTNHCLRVTAISVLRAHGVDREDIRSVSHHWSTDGLRPYCQGPTDERRYDMSKHLHEHGRLSTAVVPVSQASATAPQPSTSTGGITGLSHCDRNTDMEAESAVVLVVSSPKSDCLDNGALTQVATSSAITNRNDTMVQRTLFAGAGFEANCTPVSTSTVISISISDLMGCFVPFAVAAISYFFCVVMTLVQKLDVDRSICASIIVYHFFMTVVCNSWRVAWDFGGAHSCIYDACGAAKW